VWETLSAVFFSPWPPGGSLSRTGISVRAGAKTRMAEVFSGLWLILIVVLMGSLAEAVPLSVIAGILAVVAMELIWARIPDARLIWKTSKGLAATGLLTFGSALFIPLQYTIFLGEGLSMILYIYASGMEHAEEAGDIAADEFSIPDQFFMAWEDALKRAS